MIDTDPRRCRKDNNFLTPCKVIGKVFAAYDDEIEIKGVDLKLHCKKGWNEFKFTKNEGGVFTLETEKGKAEIEIYDEPQENPPVKVGYDMTVVPHDDNGFMDWLLDYTQRTYDSQHDVERVMRILGYRPETGEIQLENTTTECANLQRLSTA